MNRGQQAAQGLSVLRKARSIRLDLDRLAGLELAGNLLEQVGEETVGTLLLARRVGGRGHGSFSARSSPRTSRSRSRARRWRTFTAPSEIPTTAAISRVL